ncbi:ABC transporter G family member 1-like protein [Anopheles sinensis]|uniref:ABC transporter G family member 1-like protein n=1 Tax=Anopheles sinensis TaxID=74873 RepID=A0A084VNI1_ANOSI|nr:ABC transporter G family member 1-like protein [Anopheles sinensis]
MPECVCVWVRMLQKQRCTRAPVCVASLPFEPDSSSSAIASRCGLVPLLTLVLLVVLVVLVVASASTCSSGRWSPAVGRARSRAIAREHQSHTVAPGRPRPHIGPRASAGSFRLCRALCRRSIAGAGPTTDRPTGSLPATVRYGSPTRTPGSVGRLTSSPPFAPFRQTPGRFASLLVCAIFKYLREHAETAPSSPGTAPVGECEVEGAAGGRRWWRSCDARFTNKQANLLA